MVLFTKDQVWRNGRHQPVNCDLNHRVCFDPDDPAEAGADHSIYQSGITSMAKFSEIFRCSGVDDSPNIPGKSAAVPGMIVSPKGWNLVALEDGPRLRVHCDNSNIGIEELQETAVIKLARLFLNFKLAVLNVDSQFRDSYLPHILSSSARFFKIHGKGLIDDPGTLLKASAGHHVEAKIRVVVLEPMTVKLAFGNVAVPGEDGRPVFHADNPSDPQQEVDQMNAIWTPQTQIIFDLVSAAPILINDRDKSIREEIARSLGLIAKEGSFPENVDSFKLRTIFNRCKNTQAHLTIFVVQKIQLKDAQPNGTTDPEWNFCVLSASHAPSTAAHEAGHHLFGEFMQGKWHNLHHPWTSKDPDKTPLMRDGGAGFKIQFDLALQARKFISKHYGAGGAKKK